ncbi:MAG: hypothetical protein LLG14_02570 [Nocardiaceae bacterium]|nr:hypothetical protein [Nocardiaceae bacterium]
MIPGEPGVSRRRLEPVWDLRSSDAALFARLAKREPTFSALCDEIATSCLVAGTTQPFSGEAYTRPIGHTRSFYLRLSAGVLVFKGTEPMSSDYRTVFEEAWEKRPVNGLSAMDHFVLIEDEVYLALTERAARNGATRTHAWVTAYAARYGEIPQTPVPVMVLRLPQETSAAFAADLQPFLTDRPQHSARRRVEELVANGLATYVYYYPGDPTRLAHALGDFPGSFEVGASSPQRTTFNLDRAVEAWIQLFARMLVVGFVPTTQIHTGNCLQAQNVAVDGGMCDIDSVEPLVALRTTRDFAAAIMYSLEEFTNTVSDALGLPASWVGPHLWQEIRSLAIAAAETGPCDERVLKLFGLNGFDALRLLARSAR